MQRINQFVCGKISGRFRVDYGVEGSFGDVAGVSWADGGDNERVRCRRFTGLLEVAPGAVVEPECDASCNS